MLQSSLTSFLPVEILIESMTGDRWNEKVRLFETVAELKKKIFKRKRIAPNRQALIFSGVSLPDHIELDIIGIRAGSTIKLVLVTRSGPQEERNSRQDTLLSDEPSDREQKRSTRHRGCSAPEDTSAKESSAGETERENDEEIGTERLARMAEASSTSRNPRRMRTNSMGMGWIREAVAVTEHDSYVASVPGCSRLHEEEDCAVPIVEEHPAEQQDQESDRLAVHKCSDSPNEISEEDLSEMSSGMLVCDLTNEFRKLKVKRHRHPAVSTALSRQRTRSKPRNENHDASSSEDNADQTAETTGITIQLPARRGVSSRQVRVLNVKNGTVRCTVCAFKINNHFNCRCGKTLCSRHRSAQAHTCSKIRQQKMQQVSD